MATARLVVPEERLLEVCAVIRDGLSATEDKPGEFRSVLVSHETKTQLQLWYTEMELYMKSPFQIG